MPSDKRGGLPPKAYTAILAVTAFLIPGLAMLLILRQLGFYPFGETSLLIMDMDNQYVQFYEHLRHIASGEGAVGSVFFSWSKAYGTNFTGLFSYYLSSPLSAMMLFFEDAQAGIFWMTVLKTALCGLSSFFFFRFVQGCKGPAVLLFTTSYALMSYNLVYSLCPMWIDAVIWLPVVLLGAEKILRGRKPWLFILSLAALLVSNYYTGYMVCLFSVLYILYRYFSAPKEERALGVPRALGTFAASYAAALGLAMWLLLPTLFDLMAGKIGYSSYVPAQLNTFPLSMYWRSFARGEYTSIAHNGAPALYGGILTGVLCLAYFCARRIRARAKLFTAAFFALLLCGFYFVAAEIVWHAFQYPNWFPFRYSFVFHFLAVSTACAGWNAVAGSAAERLKGARLRIAAAALPVLLLPFVLWDLGGNAKGLLEGLDNQFGYRPADARADFLAETKPLVDAIHVRDGGFYRMEKTYNHSMNDALGLGYKGITHYSSMFHKDLLQVTKQLGMAQSYFWNGYAGSTPVTDSLFGVKYALSRTPLPYEAILRQGGVAAYENPYVLPPAFLSESLLDTLLGGGDCFALQNEILRALGEKGVFFPVGNVERDGLSYTFTVEESRPVYVYFPTAWNTGGSLYVNGALAIPHYLSGDDNNAAYIGTFEAGERVTVSFDDDPEHVYFHGEYIYTLDAEALAEVAGRLREGGLNDVRHTASGLSGHIRAERGGYLFISIPYDEGWTVRIGGKTAETLPALGAFMSVPVSEGEHTVEISFRPKGLAAGIAISLITALGLIGLWVRPRLQHGRPKSRFISPAGQS
jgi:uncharacterized membrane protein YfhO